MRLSLGFWAKFKFQSHYCACSPLFYAPKTLIPHQSISSCYKLTDTVSHLKEVRTRLSFSTFTSKKDEGPEKSEPAHPKKKKEIKTYITLLGTDGNIISITTVEEATKLALRRNLRLVKAMDLDPKSGRAVYKLMTESEYLGQDSGWEESKTSKEKDKFIKGVKVVSLSSNTAEHDIQTKAKMMQKWLEKRLEVRVVITGSIKNGEDVFKVIEKEIAESGRIVQKRSKGQDIRFQILPPKKTEKTHSPKEKV